MTDHTTDQPRYPDITVKLIGEDGNAMSLISRVTLALRRAGADQEEINLFMREAMSGDYENVLRTVQAWVNVE